MSKYTKLEFKTNQQIALASLSAAAQKAIEAGDLAAAIYFWRQADAIRALTYAEACRRRAVIENGGILEIEVDGCPTVVLTMARTPGDSLQ